MELQWETIQMSPEANTRTDRLKVFGGWIIKSLTLIQVIQGDEKNAQVKTDVGLAQSFIPDPDHLWQITAPAHPLAKVVPTPPKMVDELKLS